MSLKLLLLRRMENFHFKNDLHSPWETCFIVISRYFYIAVLHVSNETVEMKINGRKKMETTRISWQWRDFWCPKDTINLKIYHNVIFIGCTVFEVFAESKTIAISNWILANTITNAYWILTALIALESGYWNSSYKYWFLRLFAAMNLW